MTQVENTLGPVSQETPLGKRKPPRRRKLRQRPRTKLLASFLILFVVPTILGAYYYATLATDRFASSSSFVVRGLDAGGTADLVSSFTGLTSTGSTTSDSYVVRRYLQSADLVREIDERFDLRSHYGAKSIDLISRFDATKPFEELVEYWQRRVHTDYDSTSGIITVEVQAFDAETALALAQAVLDAADQLVNDLSEKARLDSVQFATKEVERAEERLLSAQVALRELRSRSGAVDPARNAQLYAELVSSLEYQLAEIEARMQTLSASVDDSAPTMRQLSRQANSLKSQISERRAAIGAPSDEGVGISTADVLAKFEGLQIEQTFAQQRYASALSSLELARMEAGRQQRYLAVFSFPLPPEEAIYPNRFRNTMLVMAAAFVFWAIGSLITYAVRDHLS